MTDTLQNWHLLFGFCSVSVDTLLVSRGSVSVETVAVVGPLNCSVDVPTELLSATSAPACSTTTLCSNYMVVLSYMPSALLIILLSWGFPIGYQVSAFAYQIFAFSYKIFAID